MPPVVTYPSNGETVPGNSCNCQWTDPHGTHAPVGVVQWHLKVGTTLHGYNINNGPDESATNRNVDITNFHGMLYVKVEYQKVASGPWYSSSSNSFYHP